jgi:aminomethyltransferase
MLPDYQAAKDGMAMAMRGGRRFLEVHGRAPGEMLNGLLTNSPPPGHGPEENGWLSGAVVYSALLTPRGRMITDLRIFRGVEGSAEGRHRGFLLDLPERGWAGADAHFKKFLPPRLARVGDGSNKLVLLTLVGPGSPPFLATWWAGSGLPGLPRDLMDLEEGRELVLPRSPEAPIRITRNGDLHAEAWDLLLPPDLCSDVWARAEEEGGVTLGEESLEILRVEKGRPLFGTDMDEDTIPTEAGIQGRAIDGEKGCYTGQEVIIRIRDRGHINKEIHGFLLGDLPTSAAGRELFQNERDKPVGWLTSAVVSPMYGQTIALGYLRRGSGGSGVIRVGGPDGPVAEPRRLSDEGWLTRDG